MTTVMSNWLSDALSSVTPRRETCACIEYIGTCTLYCSVLYALTRGKPPSGSGMRDDHSHAQLAEGCIFPSLPANLCACFYIHHTQQRYMFINQTHSNHSLVKGHRLEVGMRDHHGHVQLAERRVLLRRSRLTRARVVAHWLVFGQRVGLVARLRWQGSVRQPVAQALSGTRCDCVKFFVGSMIP
jgi:hypothetical protein